MASLLPLRITPRRGKRSAALVFAVATVAHAQTTADTATQTNADDTAQAATTAAAQTGDGNSVSVTDLPNLSTAPSVGAASSVTVTDAPSLSSSIFHLSDVPTIAGYGVPTQVVPWTAGAPYMQTSRLPEGTVFIVVGAILGFLGAAVLAWRGMVAWSLHRSVKRAALGNQYNDSMLKLTKPAPLAVNSTAMGSTLSLERLSAPAGKLSKSHGRVTSSSGLISGTTSASAARNSSLFFSPTAGAGAHHSNPSNSLTSNSNRSSGFLPAGYYAAPNSTAPAAGAKHASVGAGATSRLSSLNPHHPSNKGYTQPSDHHPGHSRSNSATAPSPPDSPGTMGRPSTGGTLGTIGTRDRYERMSRQGHQDSWSNLSVPGGAPAGQRAPSANLEDLFEHHGNGMRGY